MPPSGLNSAFDVRNVWNHWNGWNDWNGETLVKRFAKASTGDPSTE
jgi:hypothetical protein